MEVFSYTSLLWSFVWEVLGYMVSVDNKKDSSATSTGGYYYFYSLVVPVVLGIVGWRLWQLQLHDGRLVINQALVFNRDYVIGGFTVQYVSGSLQILNSVVSRKYSLWHTESSEKAFVFAAEAQVDGEPIQDGHYFLKEKILKQTRLQTIDNIYYEDKQSLSISGTVSYEAESVSIAYTLRFFLDEKEPHGKLRFSLDFDKNSKDVPFNRIFLRYGSEKDEAFFGFGQQYSQWNLKGYKLPIIISEQGVGRGLQPLTFALNHFVHGVGSSWHTTYVAKPIYITSHRRALALLGPKVSVFDLTQPEVVTVEYWSSQEIEGIIFSGEEPLELVRLITTETGRMAALPAWTQEGVIVGIEGGSNEVEKISTSLHAGKVPLAGIWLQDWVGTRQDWDGTRLIWNWEVNSGYYPRWDKMVRALEKKGIKVLTYLNPYLVDVQDKFPHRRNLFREAVQHGYFIKNASGDPLLAMSGSIEFATIDPTNPGTRSWLKQVIIENMIQGAGSSGWMADFGEYVPFNSRLYAGLGEDLHNVFPDYWASLQAEAVAEAGDEKGKDILVFVRSGYIKTPGIAQLYWVGDQLVTWDQHDGIKTVLLAMFSGGLVGHSLTHSDVGGYTMIDHKVFKFYRSRELLFRWVELGSFAGVVYRTHLGSYMTTPSAQVWDDAESIEHLAKFGRIFAHLAPYRQMLMTQAEEQGFPVVRPLFLHFPDDDVALHLTQEFLLGPDLLIAPVLNPGQSVTKVYLPGPNVGWVHLWSNQLYEVKKAGAKGQWIVVASEIGSPPVFYRKDSRYRRLFHGMRDL